MPRAVIIGGTGAIGRATARRLIASGWDVTLTGRDPARMPADLTAAGAKFSAADRSDSRQLTAAYGAGADLLVDCICFTVEDARLILSLVRDATSTAMISSKVVYVDGAGTLANAAASPRFDRPIRETDATIRPAWGGLAVDAPAVRFAANKIAAEQKLLDSGAPATILRPSKIHGDGASPPREWVFVKRILDKRPTVILARRGQSRDHTTAAANIASLIETTAAKPGRRILNIADPDAPTVRDIAHAIAAHLDHPWREILLDGDDERLGRTPWDTLHPLVLDTTAARELGYTPAGDYATTAVDAVDSLIRAASRGEPLPERDDAYLGKYLDYQHEDAYLAALPARHRPGRWSTTMEA